MDRFGLFNHVIKWHFDDKDFFKIAAKTAKAMQDGRSGKNHLWTCRKHAKHKDLGF